MHVSGVDPEHCVNGVAHNADICAAYDRYAAPPRRLTQLVARGAECCGEDRGHACMLIQAAPWSQHYVIPLHRNE
jgi:hypothetical protein